MALTPINTGISDPKLLKTLRRMEQDLEQRTPISQYQYIDVTFNGTADNDTTIVHDLRPGNPEDVDYEVVRWNLAAAPATVPVVYRDSSASRRAWGDSYIVLRCNVASASATLRLSVRRT